MHGHDGRSARDDAAAAAPTGAAFERLDLTGLRCPLPIVRLNAAIKSLPAGTDLEVLATDPAFELDVQAWCRRAGHPLVEVRRTADGLVARLRKGG